eukprot:3425016-Amphidinium_carterae.1
MLDLNGSNMSFFKPADLEAVRRNLAEASILQACTQEQRNGLHTKKGTNGQVQPKDSAKLNGRPKLVKDH